MEWACGILAEGGYWVDSERMEQRENLGPSCTRQSVQG